MNLPIVLNMVSDIRSGEKIRSKGSLMLFLGNLTFEEINTKHILGYVSEDNPLRDTVIWHLFFHSTPWVVHFLPFMLECANKSSRQKITNAIFLLGSVIFLHWTSENERSEGLWRRLARCPNVLGITDLGYRKLNTGRNMKKKKSWQLS